MALGQRVPMIDADGCLWLGLFAGWAARRYSPQGKLISTVRFPCANITKLCFAGPDLKTVYATTAWKGLSGEERAQRRPKMFGRKRPGR